MGDDYQQLHVERREQWREWLADHHDREAGVWLVSWKQATGKPRISYEAAVEEALCFGWVDSLPRKIDERRSALRFTPRDPASRWSRLNKQRVERMVEQGKMTDAGLALVEQAKASGAWSALDEVEELLVPDDLQAALDERPGAAETWEGYPPSVKRGALELLVDAKRPETRARRVEQLAADAASGPSSFAAADARIISEQI